MSNNSQQRTIRPDFNGFGSNQNSGSITNSIENLDLGNGNDTTSLSQSQLPANASSLVKSESLKSSTTLNSGIQATANNIIRETSNLYNNNSKVSKKRKTTSSVHSFDPRLIPPPIPISRTKSEPILSKLQKNTYTNNQSYLNPQYKSNLQEWPINASNNTRIQQNIQPTTFKDIIGDYYHRIQISDDKLNEISIFILTLALILNEQQSIQGGKLKLDKEDPDKFLADVKTVFEKIAKQPKKFSKFLVSETDEKQYVMNYNLEKRFELKASDYENYYQSNKSDIVRRKIITILVNCFKEYASQFFDIDTSNKSYKKEIFKSIRNGCAKFYNRCLEFENIFDSIHSDCSYATGMVNCKSVCNSIVGCQYYSGPKRSGCKKSSTYETTYINLERFNRFKNLSEQDCIKFHYFMGVLCKEIGIEIRNKLEREQQLKNKENEKNRQINQKLMQYYNYYLQTITDINNKLSNYSGHITNQISGGSSDIKTIDNVDLYNIL